MANGEAWNIGAQQGSDAATDQAQHKRSRQEQLQDEQRQQKLSVYQDLHGQGRISTPELAHAIEDIYHDAEPEKKMSIFGRLLNRSKARKQHTDYLQGQQKRTGEEQGILTGARSLKDVQDEAQKRQLELEGAKHPGPKAPFKEFTDPTGKQRQWFRVGEEPEGWNAQQGAAPAPRAQSPSAQFANLTAKKILADKKQGPPLTNEESAQLAGAKGALDEAGVARANAFAQAAAANNLVVTTNEDGQDVLTQRSQAVAAAKAGSPMTAGVVGAPTEHDKTTQQYAVSSLNRIKEMRDIVKRHPEIFGPAGGRTMKAASWLGMQSPEAQKFRNDAQFLAEHSTAVFGGKAASTVEALKQVESDPTTNPDALLAGLDSDESTLNDFTNAGGRLPSPRKTTQGKTGGAKKKVSIKKAKGLPKYAGKPDAEIKAAIEAQGFEAIP